MRNLFKIFGFAIIGLGTVVSADAATARDGSRTTAKATVRMPFMPTVSLNTMGNMTQNLPADTNVKVSITPGNPDNPDNPDTPDEPDTPDTPAPECDDELPKNSTYTVNMCMDDLKFCVNTQAGLPEGLNNLFNEDLRNAIVNGMGLCASQVDKCIAEVRKDCRYVYRSLADVWIDFNARVVQPEYYAFILRQTGLTPNQAENTCWLLDKNAYGTSFAAVNSTNKVTTEYKQNVGAYNEQMGGTLDKTNPMGPNVAGNPNVDSQRGHYARWDAVKGECLIRVAAYNKDEHITNSWLGLGDDTPAERWVNAGDIFTCNKDFFGFSLMNQTKSAALLGLTGGAVVGAGVGAGIGAAIDKDNAENDGVFSCEKPEHRKKLADQLRATNKVSILDEYFNGGQKEASNVAKIGVAVAAITKEQCEEIIRLRNVYNQLETAVSLCEASEGSRHTVKYDQTTIEVIIKPLPECAEDSTDKKCVAMTTNCAGHTTDVKGCLTSSSTQTAIQKTVVEALMAAGIIEEAKCSFYSLNKAKTAGTGIYCSAGASCQKPADIRDEMLRMKSVINELTVLDQNAKEKVIGKATGIGAAAGVGAGGLATMITAFVEKSNITCRLGDGLDQVGMNKSMSVPTLKDFYVKWDLRLPDVIQPTGLVNDCDSWRATCAAFPVTDQCHRVQINYQGANDNQPRVIQSACKMVGSVCMENNNLAYTTGACKSVGVIRQ